MRVAALVGTNTGMTCLRRLGVRELAEAVGPRAEGVADKKEYDDTNNNSLPHFCERFVTTAARYACILQRCLPPFARNTQASETPHFSERFVSDPQTTLPSSKTSSNFRGVYADREAWRVSVCCYYSPSCKGRKIQRFRISFAFFF